MRLEDIKPVKTIDELIEWCFNEVKETEELDNGNGDEWATARVNALEEVLMHLHNIQELGTLV